jgi:pyrroloquinoline quinone (PQQ) biosynthesis protein C
MSQIVGWMPELARRLNEACAESFVFSTVDLDERLPAGKKLCLELWPFICELPVNIQAVKEKMPATSSHLDGGHKLLSVLADEERLYQGLYLKQCVLAGVSENEVLNTSASERAIRLASLMNSFCQASSYAEGVYAIVAAELAATAFARCALPWFEEYFRSNSLRFDASTIDEGLAWLRHHAKPHLRQAIWMRRMLEEIERDGAQNATRQTMEVILSAVFEILEVPQTEVRQMTKDTVLKF